MASTVSAGKRAQEMNEAGKVGQHQIPTGTQNSSLQQHKAVPHNNAYDSTNSECKDVCPRCGTKHICEESVNIQQPYEEDTIIPFYP